MYKLKCKVCGKEYEACTNCERMERLTPWRRICDTSEHYKIFVLVSDWNCKTVDIKTAYERLQTIKIDKDEIETLLPDCVKGLHEIMEYKPEEKVEHKPINEFHKHEDFRDIKDVKTSKFQKKMNKFGK